MAVNFGLYQDGKAVSLQSVDDAMRVHFGAEPDDINWYRGWYNSIGLLLALGKEWSEVLEAFPHNADIIAWLQEHYTKDAWWSR